MLIRLVSHPEDNSDHVDKLIYIEGLPEVFFYNVMNGKKYLKSPPWVIDNDDNVPEDIKRIYYKHPQEVWFQLPKDPSFQGQDQLTEYSREANCLVLDYQTRQGEQMWDQIEKILDRETPRDLEVPKPAVVGTRREWTLGATEVPAIVLKAREIIKQKTEADVEKTPAVETQESVSIVSDYFCRECNIRYMNEHGLNIHKSKMHKDNKKTKKLDKIKDESEAIEETVTA